MPAGLLRERVRFERRIPMGDDGYGNVRANFVPVATMAARIDPASGREDVIAAKLQGVQLFEITVRWSRDSKTIKATDRAVNARSGEVFNIRSAANEDEHRRYMTFTVSQGDAHG